MNDIELCSQATRAQGSDGAFSEEMERERLRIINQIMINQQELARQLLQQNFKSSGEAELKERCVIEEVGSRIEQNSETTLKVSFQELLRKPLTKKIVLRIAQSGKYNVHTKQFESTVKQAYASRLQSSGESSDVSADDEEVARYLEIIRKKLNQPGWDFGRIYLDVFDGQDIAGILKETKPVVKEEEDVHKPLAFYTNVSIFGRRHNMTGTRSTDEVPSVALDEGYYYIGEGIVQCTGLASACMCEKGKVAIVVKKVYDPESELRHVSVPQMFPSFESRDVLEIDEIVEWPEHLLQVRRAENKRKKESSQSKATKSSITKVREGSRLIRRPHSLHDFVSSASLGKKPSKKQRKRKEKSAQVQVASKPATVEVTTKSGRKASKLVK
ncbi:hypothetical protein M9434_001375 [Picochlorum sp. BPE23]|nr:hypothetical protein M9434_001375 [Picochlorum sp. BPE23]